MASIVFIPSIDDSTHLRLSTQGDSACLRRYFLDADGEVQRVENREFDKTELESRIAKESRARQTTPINYPYQDNAFWFNRVRDCNIERNLVPDDGTDLQQSFRSRISDPAMNQQGLAPIRDQWIRGLAAINPWTNHWFNHWCRDRPEYNGRAKRAYNTRTGRGWQEALLDYCRRGVAGDPIQYIKLHGETEKLFFAAQEVGFSISANNNSFANDRPGLITPDGIGQVISHNAQEPGWAAVLEVKGPQDNNYAPEHAIPQAFCGAAAMYANRQLVGERFANPPEGASRPAANVLIRQQVRDISLFLLISTTRIQVAEAWSNPSLEASGMVDRVQLWLATFGFVKDVRIYLFPDEVALVDQQSEGDQGDDDENQGNAPNIGMQMQQRRKALEKNLLTVLEAEPSRVITPD